MSDITSLQYLNAIYGRCSRGDIVFVKSTSSGTGKAVAACFKVNEIEQAADFINAYTGTDLYIKVNPMNHQRTLERNAHGVGGCEEVDSIVSFHLDVDAGKSDKYLTPELMLDALDAMPLAPSFIVQTNGDEGGFHAYWLLDEPFLLDTEADRQRASEVARRWLAELRYHAKPGTIDGTANLDRVLRPIGSLRSSGNIVRAFTWSPHRRFTLDEFVVPDREPPKPAIEFNSEPFNGDSPIEKYLDAVGLNSVEALLQGRGYENLGRGFWRRPGSESGAATGEVYERGFTVKSGAADPLSSDNAKGATGNWYSIPALFVSFHTGLDASNGRNPQAWKEAAAFCKAWLDARAPKADTSHIERPATSGAKHTDVEQTEEKEDPQNSPCSNARVLFDAYLDKLRSGRVQARYKIPDPFGNFELGPGLLAVLGAPPGIGKTTLASQLLFSILEANAELTATICNAEMSFDVIARREIVRRTRVKDADLRTADLTTSDWHQIDKARDALYPLLDRVRWLEAPYTFARLAGLRGSVPGLLIVDYLQKFAPTGDARQGVNSVMAELRHLCLEGWGVLALSATSRTHSRGGSSHDSSQLTMASFKESGEVEFNADAAYLLRDKGAINEQEWLRFASLDCVKNRNGSQESIELEYNKPRMSFAKLPAIFAASSQGPYDFGLDEMANPYEEESCR